MVRDMITTNNMIHGGLSTGRHGQTQPVDGVGHDWYRTYGWGVRPTYSGGDSVAVVHASLAGERWGNRAKTLDYMESVAQAVLEEATENMTLIGIHLFGGDDGELAFDAQGFIVFARTDPHMEGGRTAQRWLDADETLMAVDGVTVRLRMWGNRGADVGEMLAAWYSGVGDEDQALHQIMGDMGLLGHLLQASCPGRPLEVLLGTIIAPDSHLAFESDLAAQAILARSDDRLGRERNMLLVELATSLNYDDPIDVMRAVDAIMADNEPGGDGSDDA